MVLVSQMPGLYAALAGNMEMVDYCDGKLGCWGITEPDHGSDSLDPGGDVAAPDGNYGRPNCVARIEGDKIIINGQKSAWVSGGTVAEVCALYCFVEENGETRLGVSVIVPLDLPGVTKGKALEKIGLRGLNQGEIYFDNVEVPISHLLAGPDTYVDFVRHTLAEANVHVGNMAVGLARAAYEHALAYAVTFFYSRMHVKDASISRYPEWGEYAARSDRLIPWKLLAAPFRAPMQKAAGQ